MEGGDQNLGNGGSRWNPTKEQINMLENLYKQGLRTPTAEQIQQITVRLRDFGHIEGKNVFYWFQNHKARQRQKQKQESFAYNFNHFLHAAPVFSPYHPNVVCSPCYMPAPNQQYPKVPLPTAASGCFRRSKLIPENIEARYNKSMHEDYLQFTSITKHNSHHQETLDLFPIHPTGILQAKNGIEAEKEKISTSSSSESDCYIVGNYERGGNINGTDEQPFFDFFCKN